MITYQPTLQLGVGPHFIEHPDPNHTNEPPSDPVSLLTAMLAALQRLEPNLLAAWRRACLVMDLALFEGLIMVIRTNPKLTQLKTPNELGQQVFQELSNNELFSICRDALRSDRTERIFNQEIHTNQDLHAKLIDATVRLQWGDDPRQPW